MLLPAGTLVGCGAGPEAGPVHGSPPRVWAPGPSAGIPPQTRLGPRSAGSGAGSGVGAAEPSPGGRRAAGRGASFAAAAPVGKQRVSRDGAPLPFRGLWWAWEGRGQTPEASRVRAGPGAPAAAPPAPHSQAVPHSSVLRGHPRGALHVRPPTAPTEMLRPGGTPRTLARSHRCGTCRFALCPPRPGASCVGASGANVYTGAQGPKGFLSLETERSACQTRAAVPGKAPSLPASQN